MPAGMMVREEVGELLAPLVALRGPSPPEGAALWALAKGEALGTRRWVRGGVGGSGATVCVARLDGRHRPPPTRKLNGWVQRLRLWLEKSKGQSPLVGFQGGALTFVARHDARRDWGQRAAQGGRASSARAWLFRQRHYQWPACRTWPFCAVRSPMHASCAAPSRRRMQRACSSRNDLIGAAPIVTRSAMAGYKLSEFHPLAADRVRFVGEPIAMCIAASRAAAEDLAELVEIDYEELPAIASSCWAGTRRGAAA